VNGINLGNANVSSSTLNLNNAQIFGNFGGDGWEGTARECIIYPVTHTDFTIAQINNMM